MQFGSYSLVPPGYPMPVHFSFQVTPPLPGVYPGHGVYSASPYATQAGWGDWGLWYSWGGHAQ